MDEELFSSHPSVMVWEYPAHNVVTVVCNRTFTSGYWPQEILTPVVGLWLSIPLPWMPSLQTCSVSTIHPRHLKYIDFVGGAANHAIYCMTVSGQNLAHDALGAIMDLIAERIVHHSLVEYLPL